MTWNETEMFKKSDECHFPSGSVLIVYDNIFMIQFIVSAVSLLVCLWLYDSIAMAITS